MYIAPVLKAPEWERQEWESEENFGYFLGYLHTRSHVRTCRAKNLQPNQERELATRGLWEARTLAFDRATSVSLDACVRHHLGETTRARAALFEEVAKGLHIEWQKQKEMIEKTPAQTMSLREFAALARLMDQAWARSMGIPGAASSQSENENAPVREADFSKLTPEELEAYRSARAKAT